MTEETRKRFGFGILMGILIILAGTMMLLKNLDLGVDFRVWDYWPVLVIVWGLGHIFCSRVGRSITWGLFLIAVGVLLQLNNLDIIHFRAHDLWPLLIILIGISVIRCGFFPNRGRCYSRWHHHHFHHNRCGWDGEKNTPSSSSINDEQVNISALLGGGKYNISSKKLKGGRITVTLGGCELDFTQAEMEGDSATLDIATTMGGVELRVPRNWRVIVNGTPIMGAIQNETSDPGTSAKQLFINGSVVMGSIEVKY